MADRVDESLQAALAALAKWLDEASIPAVIIGGVAASVLGRPRLTRDIDALAILPEDAWLQAMRVAVAYGIVPRIEDALSFARKSRVLLMRHSASAIGPRTSMMSRVFLRHTPRPTLRKFAVGYASSPSRRVCLTCSMSWRSCLRDEASNDAPLCGAAEVEQRQRRRVVRE